MLSISALLLFAISSTIILILYYLYFFIRLSKFNDNDKKFTEPISVIICAKNEAENLKLYLPNILNQTYSKFEVIVVNDQSSDNTNNLLKDLQKKYNHLIIANIDSHIHKMPGKKFALTIGIKTAKYDKLILTDADCNVVSKFWIQSIANNFTNYNIILGYGGYEKEKGILNKFIRYDTFNVAQQYLSYCLAGYTYMGVGRNLAYTKDVFFNNKGFASHMNIPSGDDDLFIQEVANNNNNISIEISEDSHTISRSKKTWSEWMYQKRRHLTTSKKYINKFKIILSIYPYSQLIFWLSIILLILLYDSLFGVLLLIIRLLFTYIINYKTMKKLNVFDLYWIHPIYEIGLILLQGFFVLLNVFNKPKNWSR